MTTLFRNALVVAMDDEHRSDPFRADVLVVGDRIDAVGPEIEVPEGATVVDCTDRLIMPGLVNAHVHSWEALFKGRYDNLPLELWMLLSYPILGVEPMSDRLVYLRTLLVGLESLRNGATCLLDDVIEMPTQSLSALDEVFRGYEDIGIRANCSGNIVNRPYIDSIPYVEEVLPAELLAEARAVDPRTVDEYLAISKEALSRYDGRAGRLRYVIAPSGPQRCTDDLFIAANELSREHDTTYHVHVLETKMQAVTGREFYGSTLVEHLDSLGVLSDRATLAHGIWLTDTDIARLGEVGASVAHNPISNLKLGSGIAPWRALLDAGVNLGLGSDGLSSNDSARMFDVVKSAALLHKVTQPDYTTWPTADEVLWAATRGGATSARVGDQVGAIAPGRKADFLMLDLRSVNFTPANDIAQHLVYVENGESITEVWVNGEPVVRDGRCLLIDEDAVLDEVRELGGEYLERFAKVEDANKVFEPYFRDIYQRCCGQPLGINRFSDDDRAWVGAL
ncbi:amidohydrolase family protein [Mycolicibacterium baixiangningiae]|uniref:amidohydrolase family protein n=1 Tax=Mycolicibacterium baixiangningiae TaxID=2761578 RepID=UPI0018679033|nr:amidohydrolase [Mycolicibacterium baixiangningiae]